MIFRIRYSCAHIDAFIYSISSGLVKFTHVVERTPLWDVIPWYSLKCVTDSLIQYFTQDAGTLLYTLEPLLQQPLSASWLIARAVL